MPSNVATYHSARSLTEEEKEYLESWYERFPHPGAYVKWKKPSLYQACLIAGMTPDDIDQEGWLGIIRAAKTFDPKLGNKFTTYAGRPIIGFVHRAMLMKKHQPNVLSGDAFGEDGNYSFWSVLLVDRRSTADEVIEDERLEGIRREVRDALNRLPERQRLMLVEYYGLDSWERKSMIEVGKIIGRSKQAVDQNNQRSIRMLEHRLRKIWNKYRGIE